MKRTVRRADEPVVESSPITPKGQFVYSTIKVISDPNDPTVRLMEELTPGKDEALKVLSFLDDMNGIGWTGELKQIEKDLRSALHDLMGADTK